MGTNAIHRKFQLNLKKKLFYVRVLKYWNESLRQVIVFILRIQNPEFRTRP